MKLSLTTGGGGGARRLRIALAGYGVVGQALAARLAGDPRFEIAAILVRDPVRGRAVPPPVPLGADRARFAAVPADILIDALSCPATAAQLALGSLPRGVHFVSAGKQAIAANHRALGAAALAGGARLLYSAAVGGEAPVLETAAAARQRGPVEEVRGVLNGTVNYILDRLSNGLDLAAALAEARRAGFAEEDSSADLSGADAAAKLRLIAAAAFGADPEGLAVATEALDPSAAARIAASGERWVQLARVDRHGAATVRLVPQRTVPDLPHLPGEYNCAAVQLRDGTVLRCRGRGAGGAPTAAAILSDLAVIAAEPRAAPRAVAC